MIFEMGELFSGPGGLGIGAKHSYFKDQYGDEYKIVHRWARDYDEWACKTYEHNICPDKENCVKTEDVRTLDITKLPPIDAFSFGFPCNDFSIVGEQKGMEGEFGPLYSYGVKVLDFHHPQWFIAENVGGLTSANEGQAFINILNDLANAGPGYELTPHLYKFEEYGVPQRRHRIIIVGIRKDLGLKFKVPAPTHINNFRTVRQEFEENPIPENAKNHEFTRHTKKVIEMLEYIPAGKNAWYEGIPDRLRLNVKGARLSQIYKRLHPDEPSYTITGSGGGGTHVYHWDEPRALTNRERARLQTFPDNFEFIGPKEKVRQQIGMAVPPKGAQIIIESILKTFAREPYEYINPKWSYDNFELVSSKK